MKIVNYNSNYYNELVLFCQRMWPKNSQKYLNYKLFEFPENPDDNIYNLLVISDDNKIIGCNFFFPTKAKIGDKEEKVFWSHDTMIDPIYRTNGEAGMMLIAELMQKNNVFGIGLSDINYKIHKKIKATFLGEGNRFFILTFWSLKLVLYKLKLFKFGTLKEYFYPTSIQVKQFRFIKISNVNQLNIPNNGYWNPNLTIDFVRDAHFLNKRFFDIHKNYQFYKLDNELDNIADDCYFVVRVVERRGIPLLELVDLRYNMNKNFQYKLVISAVLKIIKTNKLPIGMMKSNISKKKISLFPLMFKTKDPIHFLTYNRIKGNVSFFITFADSDAEPDLRS